MKIHLRYIAIGLSLTLLGCGESPKDKAYYETHIDEAIAKIADCESSMEFAIRTKDENKFKALKADKECDIAHKVSREHKRKIAKVKRDEKNRLREIKEAKEEKIKTIKRKEEEKIRRAERAKASKIREAKRVEEKRLFDIEYKKYFEDLKALNYQEFVTTSKSNNCHFGSKSPKCKAYKDLKEPKKTMEFKAIASKYQKQKLLDYQDNTCKVSPYSVNCNMAREAYQRQEKIEIESYHLDIPKLKKDYNKCLNETNKLNKSGKYNESIALKKTYICYMVSRAALKLKVYSWSKPIK